MVIVNLTPIIRIALFVVRIQQANNVDANVEVIRDAGSIPAASTDKRAIIRILIWLMS